MEKKLFLNKPNKNNRLQFIKIFFFFVNILLLFLIYFYKKNKHINIAMSLTNKYTYPIMVSITSILINSKDKTFINFHLLIGNDIQKDNLKKINSLKRIKKKVAFHFHNVGNKFKGWIHGRNRTVASFYRIILGEILPNINKIIYLDGDTLTYNDLSEMYQIKMDNLYFRGVGEPKWIHRKDKKRFICAGVMIMNLKLIRMHKVYDKFRNYYLNYYYKGIYYGDQYIINELFNNKIGFLPPRFGIWIINNKTIQKYKNSPYLIYNEEELIASDKNPVIRHIWGVNQKGDDIYRKPWISNQSDKIKYDWNFYAKKTGYYSSICNFFKKACLLQNKNNY